MHVKGNPMRKRFFLVNALLIFFFGVSLFAQNLNRKIDEVVNAYVALDQFSGTILVAKDGKPIYTRACGEGDKDFGVKNNLKTKFNIGSIGKTFTGTAIMQLAEQGKLDVSDPASKYLEGFPWGDDITIHHLLSHTSGTFNYFAHPEFRNRMFTIRSVNDALPLIYDQALRFEPPGSQFSYSNSGIVLLGAIIEKVTGETYADYIREHIHAPLGMNNTRINYLEEVVDNRAAGYIKTITGKFIKNIFSVPPANADGGIETNVEDMLKFDQALYGDELISEASKQKMFTPNLAQYGYCWRIDERHGNTVVEHGGGAPGINAMFSRFIDDKYTLIVMSNYDGGAIPVARTIESILFGVPYEMPKPRLAEFLYQYMEENGIEDLERSWETVLNENHYYVPNSVLLNGAGYTLLGENKTDMAIAVFKINTELFPDEANPYDSLGDAYRQKGDIEAAIASYTKALEIDPEFTSSKANLERLKERK